ncbi:MAG: hypothetical protein PHI58_07465, partial [Candidatus Omnitrophica bacterium]|nr:hypothetical protein [Candidatus Omnitrophota bacterium]
MMRIKKTSLLLLSAILLIFLAMPGCQLLSLGKVKITEMKTAPSLSEDYMPVGATDTFPSGTQKVYCWFSWHNAEANTQIVAKWRYISQNISIINHTFTLPRREGSGSVLLTMPEGKTLPSGSYRIDMVMDKRVI